MQYMSRAQKSARLVARATKFCAVWRNIFSVIIAGFPLGLYIKLVPVHMQRAESRSYHNCGTSVCTVLDVTFLALRIWGWLLGFRNICTRRIYVLWKCWWVNINPQYFNKRVLNVCSVKSWCVTTELWMRQYVMYVLCVPATVCSNRRRKYIRYSVIICHTLHC